MKNISIRVAAAIAAAITLAACGSRPSTTAATHRSAKRAVVTDLAGRPRPCHAVALGPGPMISMMTGEHAVLYKISNRGTVACSLDGYPAVVLYGPRGDRLPFRYTDGHSMYLTSAKPKNVIIPPGGFATVEVAKYRCDLGDIAEAVTIRLTLPGHIVLSGPVDAAGSGAASLAYCKGGSKDPGQTVGISPIVSAKGSTGPF